MSDYQSVDDDGEVIDSAPQPIENDRGEVKAKAPKPASNKKKYAILGVFVIGVLLVVGIVIAMMSTLTGDDDVPVDPDPSLERSSSAPPSLGSYQNQLNEAQRRAEEARLAREREEAARLAREEEAQRVAEEATNRSSPPTAPPTRDNRGGQAQQEQDPVLERRLGGNVVIGGSGGAAGDVAANVAGQAGSLMPGSRQGGGDQKIGSMLQGETFNPGSASIMRNMDMLLRRGTVIPCILQNRVVSTYPSLSSCVITRNVYSADNSTVLIERGSVAYGEQSLALQQGQARLFMTWNEVDTTGGVRVRLDSLATDNLGASGVDAYVDKHFWDRFGGAIMLSFIDDGLEVVANRLSEQQQNRGTSFSASTDNVQSMAEMALEQSINIPPTGYVNQGTRLNIRVSRDVDFSSVYQVQGRR